jgi:hypothetical protein
VNLRLPFLALVALFLFACGGSSVKHHSYAAQTLDDLALAAKKTAMTERGEALREAGMAAHAKGMDVAEAVAAAALAYQKRIDVVNGFISAKDVYVRAVLAALAKDTDLSTILPILQKALIAYEGVRALFKNTVPAVPAPVKEMVK